MDTTIILILFLLFTLLLFLIRTYYRYDNDNTNLNEVKENKADKNVSFADEENKPLETIIKIT